VLVAIVNAVMDALWYLGVRRIDIPIAPPKVWQLFRERGVSEYFEEFCDNSSAITDKTK
jgi:hypothetical protein